MGIIEVKNGHMASLTENNKLCLAFFVVNIKVMWKILNEIVFYICP